MECKESVKSNVEKWLRNIFKDDLDEISVNILGTSEKGDGYLGDIIFATAEGISKSDSPKEINVVLKCSKGSDTLREKFPVQQAFFNEITLYQSILPALKEFEIQKGIADPFQSIPKYHGKCIGHNKEVIVLENVKKSGYNLWNKKHPLPRKYLQKVLMEYAKFHAISAAMQDQEPEKFQQLTEELIPVFKKFMESSNLHQLFETNIEEICELLKDDLEDSVIQSWKQLKNNCKEVLGDFTYNLPGGLKVITHGDCWCNNFLFNPPDDKEQVQEPEVAIIDWQISYISSPIVDISYFLFTNISEEDLRTIEELLREYHNTFSKRLEKLGSSPNLYSLETFLEDWRRYCPFGLMMTNGILKACMSERSEVPDLLEAIEKDLDMSKSFVSDIKNKSAYKSRMAYILEFAANTQLITNNQFIRH